MLIPYQFLKTTYETALKKHPSAKTRARLLKALIQTQKNEFHREELIVIVYQIDISKRTHRQQQATYISLRKMIQRTRELLMEIDPSKDWLRYDRKNDVWILLNHIDQ